MWGLLKARWLWTGELASWEPQKKLPAGSLSLTNAGRDAVDNDFWDIASGRGQSVRHCPTPLFLRAGGKNQSPAHQPLSTADS